MLSNSLGKGICRWTETEPWIWMPIFSDNDKSFFLKYEKVKLCLGLPTWQQVRQGDIRASWVGSDSKNLTYPQHFAFIFSSFAVYLHVWKISNYIFLFSWRTTNCPISHFFGQYVSPHRNFNATPVVCFLNKCMGMFLSYFWIYLSISKLPQLLDSNCW